MKKRILILYLLIIILAIFLRFLALELRPLHHDEGVNGHFMLQFYRNGFYKYDSHNYHGPFIYYMALPFFALFRESIFSMRLVTALFGLGLIFLLLPLRKKIGDRAFLVSSLFIAISPTLVFYSRYFIHETFFLFFTLATIVSFASLRENTNAIYWLFISIALLLATKEISFVILFFFLIFFIIISFNKKIRKQEIEFVKKNKKKILFSITLSVLILIVLYTSFFTNLRGFLDFLSAPFNWLKTGVSGSGHEKPFYYFFKLLFLYETLAITGVFLFILSLAYVIIKKNKKVKEISLFNIFIIYWSLILILFYSIMPYKTPWLVINISLPLIIMASLFFGKLLEDNSRLKLLLILILVFSTLFLSILINFVFYESEQNMLAYVHTTNGVRNLMNLVSVFPGKINVVLSSKDYWPLPFYLKDFDVTYSDPPISKYDDICDYEIIITKKSEENVCNTNTSYFKLRPGVELVVFYNKI